jgi:hypothetical protein
MNVHLFIWAYVVVVAVVLVVAAVVVVSGNCFYADVTS